jgi:hypothetical protein
MADLCGMRGAAARRSGSGVRASASLAAGAAAHQSSMVPSPPAFSDAGKIQTFAAAKSAAAGNALSAM